MFLSDAARANTRVIPIPEGSAGNRATLRYMGEFVKQYQKDPLILATAKELTQFLDSHDYAGEAREIFNFVRDQVRYVRDPVRAELVQDPAFTLKNRYGDCDDKSTLLATMLESIGHPARFIAVGFTRPGEFEHVYVESKIGNRWIPMDATTRHSMGWSPTLDEQPLSYMRWTIK